jgi:hypothetical protein
MTARGRDRTLRFIPGKRQDYGEPDTSRDFSSVRRALTGLGDQLS